MAIYQFETELSMTSQDQRDYYTKRELEQIAKAAECRDRGVAKLHNEMAALYRRRIEELGLQ